MEDVWKTQFAACDNLPDWNRYVVPSMKVNGDEYKLAAAAVAKSRGYRADKLLGIYTEPVQMQPTRGRNAVKAGYAGDDLYVQFHSGAVWKYLGAPKEEFFKLIRSPFPDRIFAIMKVKYKGEKVNGPDSKVLGHSGGEDGVP